MGPVEAELFVGSDMLPASVHLVLTMVKSESHIVSARHLHSDMDGHTDRRVSCDRMSELRQCDRRAQRQ